ncbi:hypothetical protein CMK21_16810 [Candidatus Poribacteria bacterium]|nr:hypothetical protein [Candidatus Poribacteria bacterium]
MLIINFKDYIEIIRELGVFDVVLIDDRARIYCANEILSSIHDSSTISVHDWRQNVITRFSISIKKFKQLMI